MFDGVVGMVKVVDRISCLWLMLRIMVVSSSRRMLFGFLEHYSEVVEEQQQVHWW